MDYYKELVSNIEKALESGDYERAQKLIDDELALPYVPKDVLNRLNDFKAMLPEKDINKTLSEDEIREYLKNNEYKQLVAVEQLNKLNLREYYDLCNEYLKSDGFINAKVLLVESLVRQEISDEYTMLRDGLEYDFIPRYVMLPEESEGYNVALKILSDHYMKEPSYFLMARDLLYKECFLALPVSYIKEEGEMLAENIISYLDKVLN
ncbi:MAG: hypothetical protein ACI4WM_05060 [Erysipelotrichaceae bacterium]